MGLFDFDIGSGIGQVFKTIASPITGYFKNKQEIKKLDAEADVLIRTKRNAHIQNMDIKEFEADTNWNQLSIKNSSWKDEYWLVMLSIPMVMCFIPAWGLRAAALDGFQALGELPDWYRWAIAIMISSAYGYKKLADGMGAKLGFLKKFVPGAK